MALDGMGMAAGRAPRAMRILHSDRFTLPLPARHRFPMRKYALLRERLEAGERSRIRLEEAPVCTRAELHLAHDADYVTRVLDGAMSAAELRRLGLPWSEALAERSLRAVGATLAAVRHALVDGIAVSLAGGTHHADRSAGAGFCVFNDAAIAALAMRRADTPRRVAIVDCDVHQGDGTARILAGVDGVHTFSIHSARNYPHSKASSDCDIALPDQADDDLYLRCLACGLDYVLAVAAPDLIIYNAGADPYVGDSLGRLALSKRALAERDRRVMLAAERQGIALAVVMGGGYPQQVDDAVDIHYATVLEALASFERRHPR